MKEFCIYLQQFVASETPLPFKKPRVPKTPSSRTSSVSDVSEEVPGEIASRLCWILTELL